MEIKRTPELKELKYRIRYNPVVAILGPRQCGKTTLARQFSSSWPSGSVTVFDIEDAQDADRLEDPILALSKLKGLVVLDEIQRQPDLFSALRVIVDREPKTRFLILGSASRDLIRQGSESLAGRISYFELGGFTIQHIGMRQAEKLWVRGAFPKSFLAPSEKHSYQWRQDFISSFLERDIPQLGIKIPAKALRRFWTMLAHCHGQIFNASEIGQSLGISDHTAQKYLDLLSGTFMVRQLRPWYYNTKKRLVKRPKVYFRDTGILHTLLSLETKESVLSHPKLGASWEGFALEETIRYIGLAEDEIFFWGVHTGGELDMIFEKNGKMYGVEFKYTDVPSITSSMRSAIKELSLQHLWVIYPGDKTYPLAKDITVLPVTQLRIVKA